ncbi:hypothetical protein Murru_1339 [Allomuricauda ruestringensis DSM 13258]|uniref:Uncharacterized protein n=1 Tax=Allomuricauda ruestringensis (strain DSM 13258 / CIP 107369 / LMG 19739 / B1) TaxID=886377 RepID=G2PPC9_ALLRU|nr:hypothetical protein Murru_1339 [Allomuricauda ruestringensis DSM 13258]
MDDPLSSLPKGRSFPPLEGSREDLIPADKEFHSFFKITDFKSMISFIYAAFACKSLVSLMERSVKISLEFPLRST